MGKTEYVDECNENRRLARSWNVALNFVNNFNEGSDVFIRDVRRDIPDRVKNLRLDRVGDLKAHGDAVRALGIDSISTNDGRLISMTMENMAICSKFLVSVKNKSRLLVVGGRNKASLIEKQKRIDLAKRLCCNKNGFVNNVSRNFYANPSTKQMISIDRIIEEKCCRQMNNAT